MPMFLPDRIIVPLHYNRSTTVVAEQQYYYSCNSIYDPDYTGVGHQPMYHDWWAQQYKVYYVAYSMIKVRWTTLSLSDACWLAIMPTQETSSTFDTTSIQTFREWPWIRSRTIPSSVGTTGRPVVLKNVISPRKFWGESFDISTLRAQFGANPANVLNWAFIVRNFEVGSTINGYIEVDLYYKCVFSKRDATPAGS